MEGRYLLETSVPRMVGPDAEVAAAAPLVEQRQAALFRQADLGKEACLLARAWMRQEFGIAPEQWNLEAPIGLQVKGWFWGRRSMQRQADRVVLRLAHAADANSMTRREFARWLRALAQLGDARRGGRLALLAEGKPVR